MPVLSIGGDKSLGGPLGEQAKLVATDVSVVVVKTLAIGLWKNSRSKRWMRW